MVSVDCFRVLCLDLIAMVSVYGFWLGFCGIYPIEAIFFFFGLSHSTSTMRLMMSMCDCK